MGLAKMIGTIIMTVSSAFSPTAQGLQYAQTWLNSVNEYTVYGSGFIQQLPNRQAQVKLVLHDLVANRPYEVLLVYGDPVAGRRGMPARMVGSFYAPSNNDTVSFKIPYIAFIPEVGWSLAIREGISPRSFAAVGRLQLPAIYTPIVQTGVAGPYLVVLALGALMPVGKVASRMQGVLGDEYATENEPPLITLQTGQSSLLTLLWLFLTGDKPPRTIQEGDAVNLRLRIHVFNLVSGAVVTGLHPKVTIWGKMLHARIRLTHLDELYSAQVGMPDFQYDNDVYLPVGTYRATVQIGQTSVLFRGLQVTPTTYDRVNPYTLPPAATVKEHDGRFYPSTLKVFAGDRIAFIFDGQGADQFKIGTAVSPMLLTGQSWTYTPNISGNYQISLIDAPSVKMKLSVHGRS